MLYILFAIVFFGLLVAVHELGHFMTAKLCGVRVNEFSVGMGPVLLHKKGKETEYSLRLLPVGGFCAMEGEEGDSDDPRSFAKASFWKRFLILIAGSLMNLLAGIVIILCLYSGAEAYVSPVIDGFMDGCPAYEQGYLQVGDELLKVDGYAVLVNTDLAMLLGRGNGKDADILVRRNGEKILLHDVPLALQEYELDGVKQMKYGLYFRVEQSSFGKNMSLGLRNALNFARMVWFSIQDMITGAAGLKDLSGPVGIVSTMSEMGQASETLGVALMNLLYFGAIIAINLAVMNLLPLPALDGGRLFFLVLNGILWVLLRRKIPDKYESYVHFAGLVLLLGLMLVVALNDVYKIVWH